MEDGQTCPESAGRERLSTSNFSDTSSAAKLLNILAMCDSWLFKRRSIASQSPIAAKRFMRSRYSGKR